MTSASANSPGPRHGAHLLLGWICLLGGLVSAGRAASAEIVTVGPTLELPPFVVTESDPSAPRWLYLAGPGFEFLSRWPGSVTEAYADGYYRALQDLQILVPAELQAEMSAPSIQLLYREDMVRQLPPELAAEIKARNPAGAASPTTSRILPSMGLADLDLWATYTVLEESQAGKTPDFVKFTASAVRQRLMARTPALPSWYVEGVQHLYQQSRYAPDALALPEFSWVTPEATNALRKYRGHPRSLLPLSVLFGEREPAMGSQADTLAQPWRHQAALFIRWAFDGRKLARREALFKFVARAGEAPVTEAMFKECFGLGYADVQERLSDYLDVAVRRPLSLKPATRYLTLKSELRPATPVEIARIKGDWERLAVNYLRGTYPDLVPAGLKQSRRTLFSHYRDNDPGQNAAIALSYLDAGETTPARLYLEKAVQARVARPRPYYELAALRLAERLPAKGGVIDAGQLDPILEPLQLARTLAPRWPATYELLAMVLSLADRRSTPDELAWLAESTRLFPRHVPLAYHTARLHVLYGPRTAASALIGHGRRIATEDRTRQLFDQLAEALAARRD